ncbi:hypothetical protein MDS_3375 [Ectopseudomonas mendocina NK-01]|nr:hypothetical protein MDS_3375 [Pseudomonas mendocina NK-01]
MRHLVVVIREQVVVLALRTSLPSPQYGRGNKGYWMVTGLLQSGPGGLHETPRRGFCGSAQALTAGNSTGLAR